MTQPPFEVTETGWGEFDIGVTLHLAEDDLEALWLRLHLDHSGRAQLLDILGAISLFNINTR